MSGGYFQNSWSEAGWLAESIREYANELEAKPVEECGVGQEDLNQWVRERLQMKNPKLVEALRDPVKAKEYVCMQLYAIAELLDKASAGGRAADFLAGGDFSPWGFILELEDLKREFGEHWLQ